MDGKFDFGADAETDWAAFADVLRAAPAAHVSDGFVDRVTAALRSESSPSAARKSACPAPSERTPRFFSPASLFTAAACLVALFATASLFFRPAPTMSIVRLAACQRADGSFSSSSAAPYVQAFAVRVLASDPSAAPAALSAAVDALVRAQDAEGGWGNAPLTARNVAALAAAARAGVTDAARAYKRGLRYLRVRGIAELSPAGLAREAARATTRLGTSADAGLRYSTQLCAAGSVR